MVKSKGAKPRSMACRLCVIALTLMGATAARRSALHDLSVKLFKGSTELLLTHLVADQNLSDAEIKRIRALLSQRTKKG